MSEEEHTTENLSLSPGMLYDNQSLDKSPRASNPCVWEGVKNLGDTTQNNRVLSDFPLILNTNHKKHEDPTSIKP